MTGVLLLAVGLCSGIAVGKPFDWVKIGWSFSIWALYAALFYAERWHRLSRKRLAFLSIAAFGLTLTTLWGITFIGEVHL